MVGADRAQPGLVVGFAQQLSAFGVAVGTNPLTPATTLILQLRVGSRRLSWCWGAAACVVLRATVAATASMRTGRAASARAERWQQQRLLVVTSDCAAVEL